MDYFEDFYINQRIPFGRYTVTEAEIVEFAKRYDPQVFHVDGSHSLTAELGGIMASGWVVFGPLPLVCVELLGHRRR